MGEKVNVEDLEPRSLQTKDLFKVAVILSKCSDQLTKIIGESGIDLGELGKKAKEMREKGTPEGVEGGKDIQVFGVQLLGAVLVVAESDVKPFLADLVGMTVEEFDITPYKTSLIIIEKLAKKENLLDFFQRAMKLVEAFKPSEKKQIS